MSDHVDTDDVHRAERGALRPSDRGTGHCVDLFNRVTAGLEGSQDLHHAIRPDVIGDEVRRVFRDDHAFAEAMIAEPRYPLDERRIGISGRDNFNQVEKPGRIEEVRAQPVPAQFRAAVLGEGGDRHAGRIR